MSDDLRAGATQVARVLREAKYEAYFAGGCVRDQLLGIAPKDYDVVTDAKPEEVQRLFRRAWMVGAAFGVVRVRARGHDYEVATYRKDAEYLDGRRPVNVEYTSSKMQDVLRRDFTINALLQDPETGEVLDYAGGRHDLEAKIIRAVGDASSRIAEDRLRMIRAVRFAARLGFEIEPDTMRAIQTNAAHIRDVSVERVVAELHALWATARPGLGAKLLRESGLLGPVFTFLALGPAEAQEVERRESRLAGSAASLDELGRNSVAWAGLLDLAPPAVDREEVLRGYKLSRELIREVLRLLAEKPVLLDPTSAREADRVRLAIAPRFSASLAFLETLGGDMRPWSDLASQLAEHPLPELPLVTGQDVIALGLRPGPVFKELLTGIEDEIFERRIANREEALAWVRGRVENPR